MNNDNKNDHMTNCIHYWKMHFRPTPFGKEGKTGDIAQVLSGKNTLRNDDIVRGILSDGCEIKAETISDIIARYEQRIRHELTLGNRVLTENCQFTPSIQGLWNTTTEPFDPQTHTCSVALRLTPLMRRMLRQIGVEIVDNRYRTDSLSITRITDAATGRTDGFITRGDDVVLEGEKLKVTTDDADAGVFFRNTSTQAEYRVSRRLTRNMPSEVVARVPADLPPGSYTAIIRTRYTGSGGVTLNECREICSLGNLRAEE